MKYIGINAVIIKQNKNTVTEEEAQAFAKGFSDLCEKHKAIGHGDIKLVEYSEKIDEAAKKEED